MRRYGERPIRPVDPGDLAKACQELEGQGMEIIAVVPKWGANAGSTFAMVILYREGTECG